MKQVQLLTPVAGRLIPLSAIQDPVFSQGMMGQGFGIEPSVGKIVAPVSGEVTMVADTLHAIGFKADNGLEVLVHLGIDTVEMGNQPPFKIQIKTGDHVEAGDPIGTMDIQAVAAAGKQTTVIIAVTNSADMVEKLDANEGEIKAGVVGAVVDLKKEVMPAAAAQPAKKSGNKYDDLAVEILENVGGAANVKSVIHCITRVRFYLKDEQQANDDVIRNLQGVIDVAKAGGQ